MLLRVLGHEGKTAVTVNGADGSDNSGPTSRFSISAAR